MFLKTNKNIDQIIIGQLPIDFINKLFYSILLLPYNLGVFEFWTFLLWCYVQCSFFNYYIFWFLEHTPPLEDK